MAARHKTPKERPAAKGKVSAKSLGRAKGRAAADTGELFGPRVGRAAANLEVVLAKPRRSRDVDTSKPGTSATDQRAGGTSTARRNVKRRAPHATAALEDSRTKPSRKSTRTSANRARSGQGLEQTAHNKTYTPAARNARR